MKIDELIAKVKELGFKWQPNSHDKMEPGIFYKRVQTKRACSSNDHVQVVVTVFDREGLPGRYAPSERLSLTMDITGEFQLLEHGATEHWTKLSVYGLTTELFFQRHKEIEAGLIRAWEALT